MKMEIFAIEFMLESAIRLRGSGEIVQLERFYREGLFVEKSGCHY